MSKYQKIETGKRLSLHHLSTEQKAAILSAVSDILESVDLDVYSDFCIQYAWTEAENDVVANSQVFTIERHLRYLWQCVVATQ